MSKVYISKWGKLRAEVRPYGDGWTIYMDGWPNNTDYCRTEAKAQAKLDKRAEKRDWKEAD